ncbi:MAG: toxic anion resistance protein [Firmicutes bacterium]|nr:toxic anion resistance protein [Bacillota bacterium]
MKITRTDKQPEQTEEVTPFDLEKQKQEVAVKVQNSPEIDNILGQIDLEDTNTVMTFGSTVTEEIAKFSDQILHSMETTKVEDSGDMLVQLNQIMDKFDIKDFEEKKQGLLGRLFNKAKDSIEALFKKYHTMGDEVDKIYVTLKQYEAEISKANNNLEEMFSKNLEYYEQLEKYIYAGELAINEVRNNILPEYQQKAETSGNQLDQVTANNISRMLEMMEQRVHDLKLAENIAIQTMPSIKSIQNGNYNLVRKINSAFIITLPIFKQCLIQSIMLKRQAVQANAMQALDEKTNELLLRNAQNTAAQSKMTAQLASGSFVSVETLQKSWETIVKGIEETKQIQEDMQQKRVQDSQKLQTFKEEFKNKKMLN